MCKKNHLGLLLVTCLLTAGTAMAEEEPSATPFRPTVSNPAALSAAGWLEIETGVQRDKGDNTRSVTLPYLLKYAFTPDWGVMIGGDAYIRNTDAEGLKSSGFGDTLLVIKHHIGVSEDLAFGVEAGVRSPTAKKGLGSEKTDYILNGIVSADLGAVSLDFNVGPTRIGAREEGLGRTEWGAAAALSKSLDERWTIAGEVSGTKRKGSASQSQFLIAAGYAASKRTVFDFGFAKGLGNAETKWSAFAGVTMMLQQLR